MNADVVALGLAIGSSYAAGFVGGLATRRGLRTWYSPLLKPEWTPPGRLIGGVWAVLYTLMAIAAWIAWRAGGNATSIAIVFGGQLVLNAFWSVIFFGARRPDVAFVEILFLWLAVLATTLLFARSSVGAALLMVPYLAWVTFAGYLNYRIWRLNALRVDLPSASLTS